MHWQTPFLCIGCMYVGSTATTEGACSGHTYVECLAALDLTPGMGSLTLCSSIKQLVLCSVVQLASPALPPYALPASRVRSLAECRARLFVGGGAGWGPKLVITSPEPLWVMTAEPVMCYIWKEFIMDLERCSMLPVT